MNKQTAKYYEEFCPSLKDVWTKYLEHDAVMTSHYAGPQGKCIGSHPMFGLKHFGFEVDDPRIRGKERVYFQCYKEKVEVIHDFDDDCQEQHDMTHENCLKYLAQLPRPWYSFTTEGMTEEECQQKLEEQVNERLKPYGVCVSDFKSEGCET